MSGSTSNLVWYIGRGTGITAYLLLTFSVVLGIALSRRWHATRIPRLVVDELHRWLTITFYIFIAVHVVTMLLDPFTHFKVADVIVPFVSTYRPVWLSLGIIGAEVSIAAGASVWVRKWIGYRTWHVLHLTAYPVFFMSLLHGLGTGTDTKTTWATALYGVSFVVVAGATLWRMIEVPAWRTSVVASTLVIAVALAAWSAGGPYAPGWAQAAGTPDKLLQKAAAQRGTTTGDTVTATGTPNTRVASLPQLPATIQDSMSGQTLLNQQQTQVLLRGTAVGNVPLDIAIQMQVISQEFTGQIQIRSANHTPLCAGDISGPELNNLTATCSGYGQQLQLHVSFDSVQRTGFQGTISGNLQTSS